MDRSRSSGWEEGDLLSLIENKVEEDVGLDYKASPSLGKQERQKNDLSKDVSAFANSAGGIIVYGITEVDHFPTELDEGYDPGEVSKEWVEQVIQGRIRPRINGIHINPVRLDRTHPGRVAYVLTIPQSTTAHQAFDKKYYKRFNFESVPMEDHEIRDVMNRLKYPLVLPRFSCTTAVMASRPMAEEKILTAISAPNGCWRSSETYVSGCANKAGRRLKLNISYGCCGAFSLLWMAGGSSGLLRRPRKSGRA